MLLDANFSPRILFFFFTQGGVIEEKTKNLFFFLVLTITPDLTEEVWIFACVGW